jgi:hypothetical protein
MMFNKIAPQDWSGIHLSETLMTTKGDKVRTFV